MITSQWWSEDVLLTLCIKGVCKIYEEHLEHLLRCDGGVAFSRGLREHGPPCRAYARARDMRRCCLHGHLLATAGVWRLKIILDGLCICRQFGRCYVRGRSCVAMSRASSWEHLALSCLLLSARGKFCCYFLIRKLARLKLLWFPCFGYVLGELLHADEVLWNTVYALNQSRAWSKWRGRLSMCFMWRKEIM